MHTVRLRLTREESAASIDFSHASRVSLVAHSMRPAQGIWLQEDPYHQRIPPVCIHEQNVSAAVHLYAQRTKLSTPQRAQLSLICETATA